MTSCPMSGKTYHFPRVDRNDRVAGRGPTFWTGPEREALMDAIYQLHWGEKLWEKEWEERARAREKAAED